MKRISTVVLVFALLLCSCSAGKQQRAVEESLENMTTYTNTLAEIAADYGAEYIVRQDKQEVVLLDDEGEEAYGKLYMSEIRLLINDGAELCAFIYLTDDAEPKYMETFEVSYALADSDSTFDLSLFIDVVNALSGHPIDTAFCEQFLNAPESEYAPEKYGDNKSGDQEIYKVHSFNFWGDWFIYYSVYTSRSAELTFAGFTKAIDR